MSIGYQGSIGVFGGLTGRVAKCCIYGKCGKYGRWLNKPKQSEKSARQDVLVCIFLLMCKHVFAKMLNFVVLFRV